MIPKIKLPKEPRPRGKHDSYNSRLAELRLEEIVKLRKTLRWAMGFVAEKREKAAGVFCGHCFGGVKKEDYHGMTTDKVTHKDDCLWVLAEEVSQKKE